jgi:hypothetical protein
VANACSTGSERTDSAGVVKVERRRCNSDEIEQDDASAAEPKMKLAGGGISPHP